ncbi:hypothetical protein pEaSNUABM28_00255 [Erwinia phage pEa_SNUABM_28]|uniref:Uncharacterized protein n=1 Tax=Erwinia phage pEa_SNUABM_16 TaxID=2869544 RepID=A0AAE8XR37_9CAUD|nr:hypothetical protein MPK64_gp253 [Erwinia phage pEa_SNUABM_16]QZE58812.1 hypothetical protein pEaSNUABM28_00255 [Erwinia phage pEa_SNUABM_28]QZE59156.1 hypothetical protein pEaSNUABM18_00253 [Erwinia phage pEa_SNUABM_18]UAW96397.1 hypothetical protein pEaSNUABM16_00253 [Erwinia phage pEa_SNUABM_16]
MSLIKIEGVQSLSAPTKAQKDAAIYMFGSKGHSIVAVLDKFSRVKELRTAHIDGLLKLMKEGEDDEIVKFTASAAGKKSLAAAKQFATAKTLAMSIKALKLIRVPMKWIAGHSDAAAARITETKEIRARKTAGNKPEKPIKLDNPHAPEATTAEQTKQNSALSKIYKLPKNGNGYDNKLSPQWNALIKTINTTFKGMFAAKWIKAEGAIRITPKGPGYRSIPEAFLGAIPEDNSWQMYTVSPRGQVEGYAIGNQLTMASVAIFMRDFMATKKTPDVAAINKMVAGATAFNTEVLHTEENSPELKELGDAQRKLDAEGVAKGAINSVTKITSANVSKITRGAQIKIEEQLNSKLGNVLYNANFREKGTYPALDGYLFEMTQATKHSGSGNKYAAFALIPPQKGTQLAGQTWRVAAFNMGRQTATDLIDIGAKFSLAKVKSAIKQIDGVSSAKYTPSGKSPDSLVDEIAETPARKIAAMPLQGREEYFNALNAVIQRNMPHANVIVSSDGLTITKGSKMHTVSLTDKGWFIKTGATGKPKRIGVTFDIVDLLGMIDKSILKPKA